MIVRRDPSATGEIEVPTLKLDFTAKAIQE